MPMTSVFPNNDGVLEIRAVGELFGQEILNLYHIGVLPNPAGDPGDPLVTLQDIYNEYEGFLDALQLNAISDKYTLLEYLVQVVDFVEVGPTGRYEITYGLGGVVTKGSPGAVATTDSLPSFTAVSVSLTSVRDASGKVRKGGKRYAGVVEADTLSDPDANRLSSTLIMDYQTFINAVLPQIVVAPTMGVDQGALLQLGVLSRAAAVGLTPVTTEACPIINIARVNRYASTQVSRKQR